jgi:hypothetical protein
VSVVPALFPCLVASELLVRSEVADRLPQLLLRPLSRMLGISQRGAICFLMGVLCGFPVGMRTAAVYARRGELSEQELGHLLCFCNIPGSTFLINAVGASLLGSARCGFGLWLLCLVVSLLVGAALGQLLRGARPDGAAITQTGSIRLSHECGFAMLGECLSAAALGMLKIVSTVLFFGALLGALRSLPFLGGERGAFVRCLLAGTLELTSGVCEAAVLQHKQLSPILCAAFCGWAGLSVHFQLISVCEGFYPPLGRFFVVQFIRALLCGGGMALMLHLGVFRVFFNGSAASSLLLRGGDINVPWLIYAGVCALGWLLIGVECLYQGYRRGRA